MLVSLPDAAERDTFCSWMVGGRESRFKPISDLSLVSLAQNTAGLNFTQLRTIVADALENRTRLTFDRLSELKKEFIEAEAYGLLEFIETEYNLDMVAGHKQAKQHLRNQAQVLRAGRTAVIP